MALFEKSMSELTPEIAADVVAACQNNAEEAAGALSRGLGNEYSLLVGEATTYNEETPEGFDGAGLAILMKYGDVGVAAILPTAGSLLPEWCVAPDSAGESKLNTLAQELSMLLMPDTLSADEFRTAHIPQISTALNAARVGEDASLVPLQVSNGDGSTQLSLIWPLSNPEALLQKVSEPSTVEDAAMSAGSENPGKSGSPKDFEDLPPYSKSLLNIEVPLRVVLASKKESVNDVVEIALGSIIKFDKACDELLQLFVGDQEIADGEAIKVGDKFGFRVTAMQMPKEHFMRVPPKSAG